ncbi:MAG: hypothetical protein KKB31_08055, partial [Nanoarchaeota archaeon]|nr:hypothetical protein [Nanoarchaeota archaeon]
MKQKIKDYALPIAAALLAAGIVFAANTFPTTLNSWGWGDIISYEWANALEDQIGVTNSTVVTSHDYLIRHGGAFDITYNGLTLTTGLTAATTTLTSTLTGVDGTFTGYLTATGFTGNASSSDEATALAANGANCSAGEYPLGIDASGAVESCTDATTEISTAVAAKDECSEITNCVDTGSSLTVWSNNDTAFISSGYATSTYLQLIGGTLTGYLTGPGFTGNASTSDLAAEATALAANGANC